MRQYNSSTFAYPYGLWNTDTINILKVSNYTISRNTQKPNTWREKRPITIGFNQNYLWHFYYVKSETHTKTELVDILQYTGWWQFEENYLIIKDNDLDVSVSSNVNILPTSKSFAIIPLYDNGDEISTQFITKNLGGFTIEFLLYNSNANINFMTFVDGVSYTVFLGTDVYTTLNTLVYKNYYLNVPSLNPGPHIFNVKNPEEKLFLLNMINFLNYNIIINDDDEDNIQEIKFNFIKQKLIEIYYLADNYTSIRYVCNYVQIVHKNKIFVHKKISDYL